MTARVKTVIEELAELSPSELAELADRLKELRALNEQDRRVFRGADLVRLFETISPDPEFADDVGCVTPLFTLTQPVYTQAMAMGLGDQDTASVFEVLKKTIVTDNKPANRDRDK